VVFGVIVTCDAALEPLAVPDTETVFSVPVNVGYEIVPFGI